MKRLYQITDTVARRVLPGLYFSDKVQAKEERRRLNDKKEDTRESLRYVVSPGPDHRHYAA